MSRTEVLRLYKNLLRESQKFTSYNFRTYAIRRIQDAFKANKLIADVDIIEHQVQYGVSSLNVIKRQTVIGQMYQSSKLIIENNGGQTKHVEG